MQEEWYDRRPELEARPLFSICTKHTSNQTEYTKQHSADNNAEPTDDCSSSEGSRTKVDISHSTTNLLTQRQPTEELTDSPDGSWDDNIHGERTPAQKKKSVGGAELTRVHAAFMIRLRPGFARV